MGTAAIEQLTQAKTQAQSDIFKTGLGAQTQLLGQETQMMADMSDPWASFLGAMGTGFAEEALSGKPGGDETGEATTGGANIGGKTPVTYAAISPTPTASSVAPATKYADILPTPTTSSVVPDMSPADYMHRAFLRFQTQDLGKRTRYPNR